MASFKCLHPRSRGKWCMPSVSNVIYLRFSYSAASYNSGKNVNVMLESLSKQKSTSVGSHNTQSTILYWQKKTVTNVNLGKSDKTQLTSVSAGHGLTRLHVLMLIRSFKVFI